MLLLCKAHVRKAMCVKSCTIYKHAFDFIYKSMQRVVTKIMKWSHKALKWKTSVDNHRPLSLSLIWVFVLVDIFVVFSYSEFKSWMSIYDLNLRFARFKILCLNSIMHNVLSYSHHLMYYSYSCLEILHFFVDMIVSSRAFLGSLILIYFIIY